MITVVAAGDEQGGEKLRGKFFVLLAPPDAFYFDCPSKASSVELITLCCCHPLKPVNFS